MNRPCFRRNLTLLVEIVLLLLGASLHGIASDATSTISGRVIDREGNPIAGVLIAVQTVEISDGEVWLTYMQAENVPIPKAYAALPKSQTDKAGRFPLQVLSPGRVNLWHNLSSYRRI